MKAAAENAAEVAMSHRVRSVLAWLLMTGGLLAATCAGAEPQVDLALVIAVDVSSSMEPEEQGLQREGFIDAFRSALVHEAIRNGTLGRIAVTYVEWSGVGDQMVLVPWTVIDGPDGAKAFAKNLASKPTRQSGMTSISGAIDFSRGLLADLGGGPVRRVIDISGDGPNNDGRKVTLARDQAIAEGITINGLPIMFKRPGLTQEMEDLDVYYRECVIGGLGSFMIPLHDPEQFAMVIRTKIMREIAGIGDLFTPVHRADLRFAPNNALVKEKSIGLIPKVESTFGSEALVVPAQAKMDCVTGEKRRDEGGAPGKGQKP